jgi:predicted nucleic acid-binding protein
MKPVLIDAGVIVALLNRNEPRHLTCAEAVAAIHHPLATCEAVIAESCYLLRKIPGASEKVVANVARGIFEIPFQLSKVADSVRETMHKYRDTPADFADACLIQMADELGTGDILTLDSDFRHYRWRKTHPFNLLIPLG